MVVSTVILHAFNDHLKTLSEKSKQQLEQLDEMCGKGWEVRLEAHERVALESTPVEDQNVEWFAGITEQWVLNNCKELSTRGPVYLGAIVC